MTPIEWHPGVPEPDECRALIQRLSHRQAQVLSLTVGGHATKEIARRLGITDKTVHNTLFTACETLGVRPPVRAAALFLRAAVEGSQAPVPSLIERLLAEVEVDGLLGCWTWTGPTNRWGGSIPAVPGGRGQRLVQRVAYAHWCGPIKGANPVAQTCGNLLCVNPDHLIALSRETGWAVGTKRPRLVAATPTSTWRPRTVMSMSAEELSRAS